MESSDIQNILRAKIAELNPVKQLDIELEAPLIEAGIDSLALVDISLFLEEEYDVILSLEDFLDGLTLADLLKIIEKKL